MTGSEAYSRALTAELWAAGEPIYQAILRHPFLTELADGLRAATGRRPSVSTVCRACKRLDLRRKKNQPRRRRAGA